MRDAVRAERLQVPIYNLQDYDEEDYRNRDDEDVRNQADYEEEGYGFEGRLAEILYMARGESESEEEELDDGVYFGCRPDGTYGLMRKME